MGAYPGQLLQHAESLNAANLASPWQREAARTSWCRSSVAPRGYNFCQVVFKLSANSLAKTNSIKPSDALTQ